MLYAIIRLVQISLGAIILLILTLFGLRWLGLQQNFAPHAYSLWQQDFWLVIRTPATQSPCGLEFLHTFRTTYPQALYWVDVGHGADREDSWRMICPGEPPEALSALRPTTEAPEALRVFKELEPHPVIFNIHSKEPLAADDFMREFAGLEASERLLIHSPTRAILTEIRKQRPSWLFSVDPSSMAKFQLFTGLWLEPMANLWPDFYPLTLTSGKGLFAPERLRAELRRRNKILLLDLSQGLPQENIRTREWRGFLSTQPTEHWQWWQAQQH